MRILFVISIVAVIALVWAAIAIARHVRDARVRRTRAAKAVTASLPEAELKARTKASGEKPRGTFQWQHADASVMPAPLQQATTRDWSSLRNNTFAASNRVSSTSFSDHGSRSSRPF